ncbi:MAG: hypothetical protein ACOY3Y_11535 [Acidobacteriota bacterium]
MEPLSPTIRLDLPDPMLDRFVARVLAVVPLENGLGDMVLDRTAFFPESGGQGADHGQLGEARVVDVRVDAQGVVHHRVRGPLPRPSTELEGLIEMRRRRDHMAQHTGQHLLSAALLDTAGALSSITEERANLIRSRSPAC